LTFWQTLSGCPTSVTQGAGQSSALKNVVGSNRAKALSHSAD